MNTRRIARLPAYLTARAVDAGWLRGGVDYRRFVLLGWYRTGSNLLLSLLNSDAHVVAYSELFSPRGVFWGNHTYAPRGAAVDRIERERARDPAGFLAAAAFRPHPRRVQAVGFKLFYPQLVVRPLPGLVDALRGTPGLHVIHLRRRNMLRTLVSNRISDLTGQMAATSRSAADAALQQAGCLRLAPDECRRYFEQLDERAAESERLLEQCALLRVTYEDLVADRDAQLGAVRAFLGLPPGKGTTRLVKQVTRPLSELVENLGELREEFRGSPWAEFFEG